MKKLFLILFLFFSFSPVRAADEFTLDYGFFNRELKADINNFGRVFREDFTPEGTLAPNFVPIEAQVGKFFIEALSSVSRAVYGSLLPFLNVFVAALFALWLFMEGWQIIAKGGEVWPLVLRVVKKCVLVAVWLWILNNDPAELFMWLMAPIISLGSLMSDLILSAIASVIGVDLPNNCDAIHQWIGNTGGMLIEPGYAADLLCMPTRVSGFFYTAVLAGFDFMGQGLGQSGLTFLFGFIFVILFIYNIWKFALSALGVIVDLFFVLMFLPFTAVRECFAGGTSYDGMFKPIWDELVGLVKGASWQNQAKKFVNAVIYFVVLSLVAAVSIALLAGVSPSAGGDPMSVLIVGCLALYLLAKVDELAKSIGGEEIDGEDKWGAEIEKTITAIANNAAELGKKVYGALKKPAPAAPTTTR